MNWQAMSEPPYTLDAYSICISGAQADWHHGLSDDNTFIGVLNLAFDFAWDDLYGYYPEGFN